MAKLLTSFVELFSPASRRLGYWGVCALFWADLAHEFCRVYDRSPARLGDAVDGNQIKLKRKTPAGTRAKIDKSKK